MEGQGAAAPSAPSGGGSAPASSPSPSAPSSGPRGITVGQFGRFAKGMVSPPEIAHGERTNGKDAKPQIAGQHAPAAPAAPTTVADLPEMRPANDTQPAGAPPSSEREAPAAAPDPLDEDLHGLKARDILKAIKDGTLPDELLPVLQREVGKGENARRIAIKEALEGNERLSDYSRRLSKLDLERKTFQAERTAFHEGLQSWTDPQRLRQEFKALSPAHAEAFKAAVRAEVAEHVAYKNADPTVRQLIDGQREQAQKLTAIEAENRRLKALAAMRDSQDVRQNLTQTLNQHAPAAFQKLGLDITNKAQREWFRAHLDVLSSGQMPTREHIEQAAQALAEEIQDRRAAATRAPQQQQRSLPARGAAASAPPAVVPPMQNGGPRGLKVSEFGRRR